MCLSLVRWPVLALIALLVVVIAPAIRANGISVTINATVAEIQCTPAQRLRIRACAPAVETVTLEAEKRVVAKSTAAPDPRNAATSFEVREDPQRKVLVKTLLF